MDSYSKVANQQLDELEGRIVRALDLIGDLRSENSRLESENDKLRSEHDEMKLALDKKEQEMVSLKDQLEKTGAELKDLKEKEGLLEKRINEMLGRLADMESGGGAPRSAPAASSFTSEPPAPTGAPAPAAYTPPEPDLEEETIVIEDEGDFASSSLSGDDESVVILDEEDLPATTPASAPVEDSGPSASPAPLPTRCWPKPATASTALPRCATTPERHREP